MRKNFYESDRALSEYLLLHYAKSPQILPSGLVNTAVLNFPSRCVSESLDTKRLPTDARGLDLGCAVGRSAFELARHCREVIGIDYSKRFIQTANLLKSKGSV